MVTHLPPGMSGLLNALYWGDSDYESELQVFSELWSFVESWHAFASSYALDEDDEFELKKIKELYEQVDQLLEDGFTLDELLPPVYEAFKLMEAVNERRRHPHFSPLPAINELLMAGAAFCTGKGEAGGVEVRLGLAKEFLGNYQVLAQDYRRKLKLDDQVRAGLKKGFDLVEEGLARAQEALPEPEAVVDALADVKAGSSIIEIVSEWDRDRSVALRDTHTRFKIPRVGDEFEMALNGLKHGERSKWGRHIPYFRETVMSELESFVELIRPSMLLPNEVREELWERVDDAIEYVHQAVDDLESEELDDAEAVAQFEDAAEEASLVFSEIDQQAIKGGHLAGRPVNTVFVCIQGILAGSVPDVMLPELIEQIELKPEVTQQLGFYLESRNPDFLFEAALALANSVSKPITADSGGWACVGCGETITVGEKCSDCQAIQV